MRYPLDSDIFVAKPPESEGLHAGVKSFGEYMEQGGGIPGNISPSQSENRRHPHMRLKGTDCIIRE